MNGYRALLRSFWFHVNLAIWFGGIFGFTCTPTNKFFDDIWLLAEMQRGATVEVLAQVAGAVLPCKLERDIPRKLM